MATPRKPPDQHKPDGRPSLYRPEYTAQAEKLCLLGATDRDMAEFFSVDERTIANWKLAHPEFLQALRAGKVEADMAVAHSLYQRAKGAEWVEEQAIKVRTGPHTEEVRVVEVRRALPADTPAAQFWMKNRRRGDWRDKQDVEHSGTVTLNDLVVASMTPDKPDGEAK